MKMLLAVVGALLMGCSSTPVKAASNKGVIVLQDNNTVVLRGVITEQSTTPVLLQLIEKDRKLPRGKPLYLYVDSPGGSVVAGEEMIAGIKGLSRPVTTITSFAASMAFITVQSLGPRFVTTNGILMSHRATTSIQGQIPGEINTRFHFWSRYLDNVITPVAKRVGLSLAALKAKNENEWWTFGSDAVTEHTADKVVLVRCGSSLKGTTEPSVASLFGSVKTIWSKCPLLGAPLQINTKKIVFKMMSSSKQKKFQKAIHDLFYDKVLFLNDFVINGHYKRWFK